MSRFAASQGLIGPDFSACRVTAESPAVVSALFANLPGLLLTQVFISRSLYEHSWFFTPLSPYLG
jgi:hypothetical protein